MGRLIGGRHTILSGDGQYVTLLQLKGTDVALLQRPKEKKKERKQGGNIKLYKSSLVVETDYNYQIKSLDVFAKCVLG